ncbi:hypothetical protein [Spongiactinospora sp. 9N601]|uniref:hypothetical protein n=1 Tax=Spongiactinospora sp. 9N601 TaxID=3375149 RepID=UPI0037A70B7C
MSSVLTIRRISVLAASVLTALSLAACGGSSGGGNTAAEASAPAAEASTSSSDSGSSSGGNDNLAVCMEATKVLTDFSTNLAKADVNSYDKVMNDLSTKLKELAGKAKPEMASALNDLADTYSKFKIDATDPSSMQDAMKKATEGATKLGDACAK